MNSLTIAFFGEGPTDDRFLPQIIKRTAEDLLRQHDAQDVAVLNPIVLPRLRGPMEQRLLLAAEMAFGMHLLVVHADSDGRSLSEVRQQRFDPGLGLVTKRGTGVCLNVVPLIPVRSIESWLMVDSAAFQARVGTHEDARSLGFPVRARDVEAIADPKVAFERAVRLAVGSRRRHYDIGSYYEPLSMEISLDRLAGVPAYGAFRQELKAHLVELGILPWNA